VPPEDLRAASLAAQPGECRWRERTEWLLAQYARCSCGSCDGRETVDTITTRASLRLCQAHRLDFEKRAWNLLYVRLTGRLHLVGTEELRLLHELCFTRVIAEHLREMATASMNSLVYAHRERNGWLW
jgi:hypothetical protein